MNTDEMVKDLVMRFGDVLSRRAQGRLKCFQKYEVQREGWFDGEFLYFLDRQKRGGTLSNVDRQVKVASRPHSKRVDFKLTFQDGARVSDAWVELKHWIREQKGSVYELRDYFTLKTKDPKNNWGILPDVEKLNEVATGSKYIAVLFTPNPGTDAWNEGVNSFNEKCRRLQIRSLIDPKPCQAKTFHIGLLKVEKRTRVRRRQQL